MADKNDEKDESWKVWTQEDLVLNISLRVRLDDSQDSFHLGSFDFLTLKTSLKSSNTMSSTWFFHQQAEFSGPL